MSDNGCIICGAELKYDENSVPMVCNICEQKFESNAECTNGHFICDSCHQLEGVELIENFCNNTDLSAPYEIAIQLMKHKSIKMHGPEHHFLVPAILLTSYYKAIGQTEKLPLALRKAKQRASNVLGGFCGFYGACGAGVGNGIFVSIVLDAKPISGKEYSLANQITANTLNSVAKAGGPRCCKRNTFIAIEAAVEFVKTHLDVKLPQSKITCDFYRNNNECLLGECEYFAG